MRNLTWPDSLQKRSVEKRVEKVDTLDTLTQHGTRSKCRRSKCRRPRQRRSHLSGHERPYVLNRAEAPKTAIKTRVGQPDAIENGHPTRPQSPRVYITPEGYLRIDD